MVSQNCTVNWKRSGFILCVWYVFRMCAWCLRRSGKWCWIPGTHVEVEGERGLHRAVLWPLYTHHDIHISPIIILNVQNQFLFANSSKSDIENWRDEEFLVIDYPLFKKFKSPCNLCGVETIVRVVVCNHATVKGGAGQRRGVAGQNEIYQDILRRRKFSWRILIWSNEAFVHLIKTDRHTHSFS